MVPHRVRVAVVLVVVVAVLSGCTEATVDPNPKPVPPPATAPATSRATAVPRALSVPVPVEGEATPAVVSGAEGCGSQKRTVAATPVKGCTYLVKSACAADATTTTVSYRLQDARPDKRWPVHRGAAGHCRLSGM